MQVFEEDVCLQRYEESGRDNLLVSRQHFPRLGLVQAFSAAPSDSERGFAGNPVGGHFGGQFRLLVTRVRLCFDGEVLVGGWRRRHM